MDSTDTFITSLSLVYFKEKSDNYVLSELMEILGYNSNQMEGLVSDLIANEYLVYLDDLLHITDKGTAFLIANNQYESCLQSNQLYMPHINPSKAISFDTLYVPKKFTRKYKG